MSTIVQDGEAVLRKIAEPVAEDLFGTPELQKILDDMIVSLDREPDGVALAAPQIGISRRIFIARFDRLIPPPGEGEPERPAEVGVFINPVFIRSSQRRIEMDEGCLSVRTIYGKTRRHERATVRARAFDGSVFERGGGGILAQVFQHEIDHLDGILFIDHATRLVKVERHDEPADA